MIRVTFAGPELEGMPTGREGANCKLLLPDESETIDAFRRRLEEGPPPVRRTYTVRSFRPEAMELDIDFVDHGDAGPASAWARRATPGAFLGFAGPGPIKVAHFEADWYLLAADLSALPVVAATLEAMPADARGVAVFEVPTDADMQPIDAPPGVTIHWLARSQSAAPSSLQEDFIRALDWPEGRVQVCVAGESNVVKSLKQLILSERGVDPKDAYISGYWKIGLVEDEHQLQKRQEG